MFICFLLLGLPAICASCDLECFLAHLSITVPDITLSGTKMLSHYDVEVVRFSYFWLASYKVNRLHIQYAPSLE
jgi:hypothetical protein